MIPQRADRAELQLEAVLPAESSAGEARLLILEHRATLSVPVKDAKRSAVAAFSRRSRA
jgi:hypothetical protein